MKRSKFALSHTRLLSCDLGELVPIGLLEVLPGDTFQHAVSALVRASPLLAPVMHPVHVRIHSWFVPHRLVWNDWENFITGGPDGNNTSTFPTITFPDGGPEIGTLADYLGVPTDIVNAAGTAVSALPFRAYSLIWNEWYRDQDLQTALTIDLTDGADTTTNVALQNCAWEKDRFTSARPWEQKGPAVSVPLSGDPLVELVPHTEDTDPMIVRRSTGVAVPAADTNLQSELTTGNFQLAGDLLAVLDPNGRLRVDLSSASAITINALREALAIQRFEEARARYGSRYVEYLRYLGVRSSDARLQRPEYLGGGRQTIQFSEVLQTAEGTDPVGQMAGHGIAAMRSNRYRRFFEEHGYVITLMSVLPKTMYMDGLFPTWNKRVKEDFFQKELQHIGQAEVLNKEVYASHTTPDGVFGYQDRYDEYRRQESQIHGEFRTTLNHWHFGRDFASDPALNAAFVKAVPTEEPFAVPSEDVLYVMCKHSIQARRLVSRTGNSFIF